MHILLVEDSQTESRLIRDLLDRATLLGQDLALTVEEVDCLAAALERLSAGGVDLVLLDLVLPDSQGLDTFLPIYTAAPEVPIIILSGLDSGELALEAVRQGAQDYLVKGQVDEYFLARSIHCAVERKRTEELLRIQRDLGLALSATRGLDETLLICLDAALELPEIDCGGIYLVDVDSGELQLAVHRGLSSEFVKNTACFAPDSPQAGLVQTGLPAHLRYEELGVTMDNPRRQEGLQAISIIPVQYQGQVIACFNVSSHTVDLVPETVRTVLEAIGNSVGSAIARSQAEQAVRRQAEILTALHETALELAAQRSLPDLLGAIVARATELLQVQGGGLYLYRLATDDLEYAFSYNIQPDYTGSVLQRGEGLAGKVWEQGRPITVEDYSSWNGRSLKYEGADVQAVVGVPIYWQERFLGVLDVQHAAPHTFGPEDIAILERFAPLAAAALENARLLTAERERRQVAETLQRAAAVLGATLELDEVLNLILQQLQQVIPYDSASIQRLRGDSLEIVAGQGFADSAAVTGLIFSLAPNFPNWRVVEEKTPVTFADVGQRYPVFQSDADTYGSGHIRSWLGVPLLFRDQVIGMLALDRATVRPFTPDDCELALSFAQQAAMALENAHLYNDLQQQMEQLKQAQMQLVQSAKLAAVGELAAGVAHEINNPLTNVLGYAELLLQDKPDDHPDLADLRTITAEAHRARDIVRNLLDFARQTRPQRQRTNINQITRQTLSVVRYHLEKNDIVITEDYAAELPLIYLDEGQIKQVLLNLITNAAHAMPDGGTLRLRTRRTGDEVAVAVTDSGAGIPPELEERVFDPFFTTKPVGTGLGLSVSLGIVQSHGGRIAVESEVGLGTTLTVWLPVTV